MYLRDFLNELNISCLKLVVEVFIEVYWVWIIVPMDGYYGLIRRVELLFSHILKKKTRLFPFTELP